MQDILNAHTYIHTYIHTALILPTNRPISPYFGPNISYIPRTKIFNTSKCGDVKESVNVKLFLRMP